MSDANENGNGQTDPKSEGNGTEEGLELGPLFPCVEGRVDIPISENFFSNLLVPVFDVIIRPVRANKETD